VDFVIGPEVVPSAALKQAEALARMALPRLLGDAVDASKTCDEVRAVLVELIDVTARHQASGSLVSRLAYDGAHVTVSVGDMDCLLPAPADEPGLYLVYRIADDVGQYAGDHGGRVTWAAVATRT
jgi:hypothetical protein